MHERTMEGAARYMDGEHAGMKRYVRNSVYLSSLAWKCGKQVSWFFEK